MNMHLFWMLFAYAVASATIALVVDRKLQKWRAARRRARTIRHVHPWRIVRWATPRFWRFLLTHDRARALAARYFCGRRGCPSGARIGLGSMYRANWSDQGMGGTKSYSQCGLCGKQWWSGRFG